MSNWINMDDRLPIPSDANHQGNVLIAFKCGDISLVPWDTDSDDSVAWFPLSTLGTPDMINWSNDRNDQ